MSGDEEKPVTKRTANILTGDRQELADEAQEAIRKASRDKGSISKKMEKMEKLADIAAIHEGRTILPAGAKKPKP